jgi:hypothetical protein
MLGMKALVTVGAIPEFAGGALYELFPYRRDESAGIKWPVLLGTRYRSGLARHERVAHRVE